MEMGFFIFFCEGDRKRPKDEVMLCNWRAETLAILVAEQMKVPWSFRGCICML